jgi:hypothetical protein
MMHVGSLILVENMLGQAVNVYSSPKSAEGIFFVENGEFGIVVEVGTPANGTYYGEILVIFTMGKIGWIARCHVKELM